MNRTCNFIFTYGKESVIMRRLVKLLLIILALIFSCNIFTYDSAYYVSQDIGAAKLDTSFAFKNQYGIRDFTDKIECYGKASKIPVLMYHHLLPSAYKRSKNDLVLTTEEFEKQMEYLYLNDYTTINIRELELFLNNKLELPKKTVLITFDDGYKSNFLYAYPILKWYGFKASIALIPEFMHEYPENFNPAVLNCLSWEEVALSSDVFEYVNHTYSHVNLKDAGYKRAKAEIKQVNDFLDTDYFVYPFGQTSSKAEQALRTLNYKLAFTTKAGFVRKTSSRLYLPRQRVSANMSMRQFEALLQ